MSFFNSLLDRSAPNYSLATNFELIVYPPGLVANTTNDYGTVDSNGKCTNLKSIAPSPLTRDFPSNGVAPDFRDGVLYFNGDGRPRNATAGTFNFMSFNSPASNVKTTVTAVAMFEDTPGGSYGLLGNNGGGSSGNKGVEVFFKNNATDPDAISSHIVRGASPVVLLGLQANSYPKRSFKVLTIVTDISQSAANRQKYYLNGVEQTYTVTSTSTAVATTPTYGMELFSAGNGVLSGVGCLAFLSIQSVAELNLPFINSLIQQASRVVPATKIVDRSKVYAETTFHDDADYYLNVSIAKNPITGVHLVVFSNWSTAGHTYSETNKVVFKKSTDRFLTFSAKADVFDPAGTRGVWDCGFFFDSNGVGHGFVNSVDGSGTTPTPSTSQVHYFTTDDDGDTWANSVVTSPSDGLARDACYGNGYTANGFNYFCLYKLTNEGDFTNSARYILKWALGADISTIQWILVEASSDYINEGTIAHLGGNKHVMVCRRESGLFTQYYTDDNWVTNTNQGNFDFGGDASALKGPARISPFEIDGVACLACYYPLKSTPNLKVAYTKCSDVETLGTECWVSKTVIVTGSAQRHYGSVTHYNNNFNGFGIYTRETNSLISFPTPGTTYLTAKAALGL